MQKKLLFLVCSLCFAVNALYSQQTIVKGEVKHLDIKEPIENVSVTFEGTTNMVLTDALGIFTFTKDVPLGEQVLVLTKEGYISQRYPIVVREGKTLTIDGMIMEKEVNENELFTITLADDELNDDTTGADNISGLLSASQDVFQRTAAFEFSSSFFRVRGLDSDNGSVLINGIQMNKMYNGRPQWSNWGGLNDVVRNQELTTGLTPSAYNFGGVLGTTNINTRASSYREGGRLTYSSSNRSYQNRLMASYASGLLEDGWAFTIMLGRRWGNQGYQDATLYDANSLFASVEKKFNEKHSLNFTTIYAPNRRGKSSPNTQEVYDLKGIKYNEYWGYLDGKKKNSRIKEVEEPVLMLNHYWDFNPKVSLNTNIAYQFGTTKNSRLDYGGGANPSPAYYQSLPSYFLADTDGPDYAGAYIAEQNFLTDGQINWERILDANLTNASQGILGAYTLYDDVNEDSQLTLNTILKAELNENIVLNAALDYKNLESENYAEIVSLLGATGYSNFDSFDGFAYNTLEDPNRVVKQGDKFRYHYNLFANVFSAYTQGQFKYNKVDFYVASSITSTTYQREGLYENGANLGNSFGKGKKLDFMGFGIKGGFTYKITGKHLIDVNGGYISKAPSLRNVFTNSRNNQDYIGVNALGDIDRVGNLTEEKITSADISYIFRSPIVKAKLTGFYTKTQDANEISFYYADGVYGFEQAGILQTSDFISETLQGITKKHIGAEIGIEAQVIPTIKLKGVASIGQYTYDNNPNLYLSSDAQTVSYGPANLKNYKIAGGPQQAYSLGFEYRDPNYWFVGATANFFNKTYVDVAPITRTENFYTDYDGLPFNDYNQEIATKLLQQEEFENYTVINLIGGKSWKIKDYYIGFFASVGNLLDEKYKTGGFEQGRNANYRELRDDNNNPKRVFGSKYWYGRGANYFLNLYFRF